MPLKILIFSLVIEFICGQIINHHIPAGHDGPLEKLHWPSLNIIMHVPSENGTLKKIPIYQDPTTASRRLEQQQQAQNRNKGGRYYSNHRNNNGTTPPPPPETEWLLGRPPGVTFQRPPGVDYNSFRPNQNKTNSQITRFSAQKKDMFVDVDINPTPDQYSLENISNDNQSAVVYMQPSAGQQETKRELPSHRRHRTRLTTGRRPWPRNIENTPPTTQRPFFGPPRPPPTMYRPPTITKVVRNRYYQTYQPPQHLRREAPPVDDNKLFFSGLDEPQNFTFGGGSQKLPPFFWDGNSPMNISITQRDPQNHTIFSYTFDPNKLIPHNVTEPTPPQQPPPAENHPKPIVHRPRNRVKEAKEASKLWKNLSEYNKNIFLDEPPASEDPAEFLGFFPKHPPNIFELPKFKQTTEYIGDSEKIRQFYSSINDESLPKDDLVLTAVNQDETGSYMYHHLENNDRKTPSTENMVLVTSAPIVNKNSTENSGKYILMQLKKPPSKENPNSFQSKVEPLIITSIYRQFLADAKKNATNQGPTKQRLHFSFKLGPAYFNKELVKPTNVTVGEQFHSDDEKYDSMQFFHD